MTQEALRMALEALEKYCTPYLDGTHPADEAITAIKEALAQEQEPVAWMHQNRFTGKATIVWDLGLATPNQNWKPLYTTPPQRTWVGLTDEGIDDLWESTASYYNTHDFARAIEAKLKQKNGYAEEKNI